MTKRTTQNTTTFAGLVFILTTRQVLTLRGARRERIYAYSVRGCTFEHFDLADLEPRGVQQGRFIGIHERIAQSSYITRDPANATLFYVPAAFWQWDNSMDVRRCNQLAIDSPHDVPPAVVGHTLRRSTPLIPWFPATSVTAFIASLWFRNRGRGHHNVTFATFESNFRQPTLGVGLVNGCPAAFFCETAAQLSVFPKHRPENCQNKADDFWVHIGVEVKGKQVWLYVDGKRRAYARRRIRDQGEKDSAACLDGEFGPAAPSSFVEFRSARLFKHHDLINSCGGIASPDADCFVRVREAVSTAPWVHRHEGRDHFVLLGGYEFPTHHDAFAEPAEVDFTLEAAWPAFGQFAILHYGGKVENCAAPYLHVGADRHASTNLVSARPKCARRVMRLITIPALMPDEPLICKRTAKRIRGPRVWTVAYRGLAYSGMPERFLFSRLPETSSIAEHLINTGHIKFEFANWTTGKVANGHCDDHAAFEGLCPWSSARRKNRQDLRWHYNQKRTTLMVARVLEIWNNSVFCLVLPGDGGYERRLWSIMNAGCLPVFVNLGGFTMPKVPFATLIPWYEFAIFAPLFSDEYFYSFFHGWQNSQHSPQYLLIHLLSVSAATIDRMRNAMLKYMPLLSWNLQEPCGRSGSALDFTVLELGRIAALPTDMTKIPTWNWRRKDSLHNVMLTAATKFYDENSCPYGFPNCERKFLGDKCFSTLSDEVWTCPIGCELGVRNGCSMGNDKSVPCRSERCEFSETYFDKIVRPANNTHPRIALLTWSDRPQIAKLTQPYLERFVQANPGRYDLLTPTEPLLDQRDWHPSWNKIAMVKRALLHGHPVYQYKYRAVIWVSDDIAITNFTHDLLHQALQDHLLCGTCWNKFILASPDPFNPKRTPCSTDLIAFRYHSFTFQLLEQFYKFGNHVYKQLIRNTTILPRRGGYCEQDAIAQYITHRGAGDFALLPPSQIQSVVREGQWLWEPGHFAAHFTGFPKNAGRKADFMTTALEYISTAT